MHTRKGNRSGKAKLTIEKMVESIEKAKGELLDNKIGEERLVCVYNEKNKKIYEEIFDCEIKDGKIIRGIKFLKSTPMKL